MDCFRYDFSDFITLLYSSARTMYVGKTQSVRCSAIKVTFLVVVAVRTVNRTKRQALFVGLTRSRSLLVTVSSAASIAIVYDFILDLMPLAISLFFPWLEKTLRVIQSPHYIYECICDTTLNIFNSLAYIVS